MCMELRRYRHIRQNIHRRKSSLTAGTNSRNIPELLRILESFEVEVDKYTKSVLIRKDFGNITINLNDGSVHYTPMICLQCDQQDSCKFMLKNNRKLCIIADSKGWSNVAFSDTDILLLSKIFACLHDRLPSHVYNQIKSLSGCFNKKLRLEALENSVSEQIKLDTGSSQIPPIFGPNPPPNRPYPLLRFSPPPQEIKYILQNPKLLKFRSQFLEELKDFYQLLALTRSLEEKPLKS